MAMLDNLTTQVNLAWDKAELESISDQVEGFDVGDFGFEIDDLPQVMMPTEKQGEGEPKEHDDLSGGVQSLYQIAIDCESEAEEERIYNQLKDRYKCRVLTL
jgi:hypothetical protein